MCFFHHPEGRLHVTHGHVQLPPPRRVASVAHDSRIFFHVPEGSFPSCTPYASSMPPKGRFSHAQSHASFTTPKGRFRYACSDRLSRFRRIGSNEHSCIFHPQFRRTASVLCAIHFFRVPEGSLPSCTPHASSTPPKGSFRCARPFFPSEDPPKSIVSL